VTITLKSDVFLYYSHAVDVGVYCIAIVTYPTVLISFLLSLFFFPCLQLAEMEARVVGAEARAEIAEEKVMIKTAWW